MMFLFIVITATAADEKVNWLPTRIVAVSHYPTLARAARIQGVVRVHCTLDVAGNVLEARAASGHPLLIPAATANALKWRFRRESSAVKDFTAVLIYSFQLAGKPVNPPPKFDFVYEEPNKVFITSEPPCPDHLPCLPE
jgi:TonB family protein